MPFLGRIGDMFLGNVNVFSNFPFLLFNSSLRVKTTKKGHQTTCPHHYIVEAAYAPGS
jgi:hypothetical protein